MNENYLSSIRFEGSSMQEEKTKHEICLNVYNRPVVSNMNLSPSLVVVVVVIIIAIILVFFSCLVFKQLTTLLKKGNKNVVWKLIHSKCAKVPKTSYNKALYHIDNMVRLTLARLRRNKHFQHKWWWWYIHHPRYLLNENYLSSMYDMES